MNMGDSEAKKRWDKENMVFVGFKLFRALCFALNALLQSILKLCEKGKNNDNQNSKQCKRFLWYR